LNSRQYRTVLPRRSRILKPLAPACDRPNAISHRSPRRPRATRTGAAPMQASPSSPPPPQRESLPFQRARASLSPPAGARAVHMSWPKLTGEQGRRDRLHSPLDLDHPMSF
jgi:hypothetical protein